MAKIEVKIGYRHFVMEGDKAVQLLNIIENAEMYESKWKTEAEGGTTHHIYKQPPAEKIVEISYLTEEQYRMYKLAGKPSE
jgi:predicted DNA-binding ArsR family transcriptional regulator